MTEFEIIPERQEDLIDIQALYERAFGPGRFARTAYRIREHHAPVATLSLVARDAVGLKGTIRFTAVSIGDFDNALLLGPLAVAPEYSGQGVGRALVREGVERASKNGTGIIVLVGDLAYYQPLGFARLPAGTIRFPGPVDPMRILVHECGEGVSENLGGMIRAR